MQEKPILVKKKDKEYLELVTHRVKFVDKNGEQEVYTSDVAWYEKFATMHSDFDLLEVTEMTYTAEQLSRLEEVKNLDIADTVLNDYVMEGVIGKGLEILALKKENEELKQLLADLTEVVLLGGAN